jgi:hypothetical protein
MKLRLFGIDFEERIISFQLTKEEMENRSWRRGAAEVDVDAISDDRRAQKAHP